MMSMLAFALFSTIIMASMLFVSLVNYKYQPEIDTVEQLAKSGLPILVEDNYDLTKYGFLNTKFAFVNRCPFTVSQSVNMSYICLSIKLPTI